MNKFPLVLLILLCSNISLAQLKVGDNPENINKTSLLELESRDKTLVLTRVNNSLMQKIKPLEGALVYNTDQQCVYQFNGKSWQSLCEHIAGAEFTITENIDGTVTIRKKDGTEIILVKNVTENAAQDSGQQSENKDTQQVQGPQGPKGDTGEAGPQGPAGADGADGAIGPQGPKGDKGDTGETGPQGLQGPKGDKGDTGETGPQGPAGADGADGAVGPQGPQGPAGTDGADGATGPQGPQGPAGADGADGAVGPQGPKGDKGDTGPQGPAGADGADGAVGPQGPKGDIGATGPQGPAGADGADGAVGPQGPKGDKGDTGETGPQGPVGADGADGAVGPQGPKGDKGDTGPQGPAGADGADGAIGPQGPKGDKGDTGETGPQGPEGPQGPPGPSGETTGGSSMASADLVQNAESRTYDINNQNLSFINGNVGIATSNPTSKLQVNGAFSSPIRSTLVSTTLNENDHTLIMKAKNLIITLPPPEQCIGRTYILVNISSGNNQTATDYTCNRGTPRDDLGKGKSIWLQSDGTTWQQTNIQ